MSTPDLYRLIALNAYAAYTHLLVGTAAPFVQRRLARTRAVVPGDVVLELSTRHDWMSQPDASPGPALGVLVRLETEPRQSYEDFCVMREEGDTWTTPGERSEDIPTETIYVVAPLDGSVLEYRWANASFILVWSTADACG